MIDRICLLKLADSATREEMAALLPRELGLASGVLHVQMGLPADPASAKSWDLSCVLSFQDLAAHDACLASQGFQATMASLDPRVTVLKAWSFLRI